MSASFVVGRTGVLVAAVLSVSLMRPRPETDTPAPTPDDETARVGP
ncbi:hypothetical protein [Streptomyces sp. NRRL B-1347]|nr:hypothetical protein [Streptomyces sp. NRRL B-1347]